MKLRIWDRPSTAASPTGPVLVRPYQIVVPIFVLSGAKKSPEFPAILNTGHTHNLAMSAECFRNWVRLSLKPIGSVRINQQDVPLFAGDLELEGKRIGCADGIAVFPRGHRAAPRLPLLGLRALVRSGIRVVIDGWDAIIG